MAAQRQKNVKRTVGKRGNFRFTKSGAGMIKKEITTHL